MATTNDKDSPTYLDHTLELYISINYKKNMEQEITFAELEHKGGQHKQGEFPKICFECHKEKKWLETMEDRGLLAHNTGIYE